MKSCKDSRNNNKYSRGIRRLTNGRNYVPKVPRHVIWKTKT